MGRVKDMLIMLEEQERIDIDSDYVFIPGVGIYPRSELNLPPEPEDEFCALCTPPKLYPLFMKEE